MKLIYHIVPAADWASQEAQVEYRAGSLATEGFIHLSEASQVAGTLHRYYRGVPDLLLLHVAVDKLVHTLLYEESTNQELFPHLYGPLNKDAIVRIEKLEVSQ